MTNIMNKNKNSILFVILLSSGFNLQADVLSVLAEAEKAYQRRDTGSAIQFYQIAIRDYPDSIEAKVGLAKCYASKSQNIRSENLLNEALMQDAGNTDALFERGKLYFRLQKNKQAIRDFKAVIEIDPARVEAYRQLANLLEIMGQQKEADALYTTVETLRPTAQ